MNQMRIVITGSSRGLGLALAREFLAKGCAVVVSGSTRDSTERALGLLRAEFPGAPLAGGACDVREIREVDALWGLARETFGGVDHWINNAGVSQPMQRIWEIEPAVVEDVVRTDLLGVFHGVRVAMRGMVEQGSGTIWLMEGHGSDGRIMKGLSVYGTAKRAVRYLAAALAVEAEGTGVRIGTLSPGIMITDFTMGRIDRSNADAWERTKRVFNILADKPETVATFLVPRILASDKGRAHIAWLTQAKILRRFLSAPFVKRQVIEE